MSHSRVCKLTFVNVQQVLWILVEQVTAWCSTSYTVRYWHFFNHLELLSYSIHFEWMRAKHADLVKQILFSVKLIKN
jgi:hypothetical protein